MAEPFSDIMLSFLAKYVKSDNAVLQKFCKCATIKSPRYDSIRISKCDTYTVNDGEIHYTIYYRRNDL